MLFTVTKNIHFCPKMLFIRDHFRANISTSFEVITKQQRKDQLNSVFDDNRPSNTSFFPMIS